MVAIRKWGERKLAYDIEHKTRGTYILAYFKADGRRIAGIEKDVLLSEKVMRVPDPDDREAAAGDDRAGHQGSAAGCEPVEGAPEPGTSRSSPRSAPRGWPT